MTTANKNQTRPELPPDAPLHREGKLRSADGKMATMIGYWDRHLRNRFCNLAYAQWFGRQPDAMPGTHLRDFIGEERYRINLPHIEAALAGEEQRFEVPAYTADGKLSWHGLVQYIPDFIDGQVQGVYIIVSDISAVKETEAAMRKNENLLRESQTAARIGSYINTLATGAIECTPVMDEIFGMAPDYPHTNQGWMKLIHRDYRQAMQDSFADSINNKKPLDVEFKIIRPSDGAERWMHGLAKVAEDEKGNATSLIGTVQDITERKLSEEQIGEQRRFLDTVNDNVQANIYIKDENGRYLYVNQAVATVFGRPIADILGKSDIEIQPPQTARQLMEFDSEVRVSGVRHATEEMVPDDSGTPRYYWSVKMPIAVRNHPHALIGFSTDITERKVAEEAQRIASTAFESQQGTFITDANKVILRVNKAFTSVTGYTLQEAVGQTPALLKSGRQNAAFYAAMWDSISRTGTWQGEIWNRRKNGTVYPEHLSISSVKDDAGLLTHYVGTFNDLTSYKAAEEQIDDLAYTDLLTGLSNRRKLIIRLQQALMAGEEQQHQCALLMLDLDNFKNLNDAIGHAQGDEVLHCVAKRLAAASRDGDTVARLGGDEFVVLLDHLNRDPQIALRQVQALANKIIEALNTPYQLAGSTISCTASIGITFFGARHEDTLEPLKRAELALYQAKSGGRNMLCFFDPQMQAAVDSRVKLVAALQEAIQNQQFTLYYQAQVSDSEGIVGVEALVRWFDPKRGMVSPAEFIPLAEETGLILPIGSWVLETACQQLAAWAAQPAMAHLSIAVNVSARQFRESNFVSQTLATLERTRANPQRLKLELTESVLIADAEDVIVKMNALKAIGIGFAIDDFGTGYSSLSYLKRLPLERLKIDQGFVRNILMDPDDAAISRAVIAMATSMGLGVIAEGVETEAQRDFLSSLGCHTYQGYLFSKPLPVADFEAFATRF